MISNYIPTYTDGALSNDVRLLDLAPLQQQLRSMAASLDSSGKENLVTHLVLVSLADKAGINETERNLLLNFGSDLGMTEVHCRATIQTATGEPTTLS